MDKGGNLVNKKGYLVNKNGDIVNRDGHVLFAKECLKNGEFPKLFPFTKFSIKKVQGNLEIAPDGTFILTQSTKKEGQFVDRDGRPVNRKGYLIDLIGNVVDERGNVMFEKSLLKEDGEIPSVFRQGLFESDS